jgi:hypothetical protein
MHDSFIDPVEADLSLTKFQRIHCGNFMLQLVRNAIKGVGTDDEALTRVIVTRAERDLNGIKELYYLRNSVSLDHAVAKETSGDYKAFLLALLGKED